MPNLALLIEIVVVVLVTYFLLAKRRWQLGDRIFWTIMAAVGSAICWLKWIEPALTLALSSR